MGSKILVSPANNNTTASSSSSSSTGAKYIPVWVSPAAELGAALDSRVPPLFLGLDPSNKAPHFAVQVTKDSADSLASNHAAHWVAARSAGPDMSRSDAALMAVAAGLAQWNLDTQFHGASGAPTLPQVRYPHLQRHHRIGVNTVLVTTAVWQRANTGACTHVCISCLYASTHTTHSTHDMYTKASVTPNLL
jgi:NADH pyrophosphatase NudC (nudix superfamily)